MGDPPDTGETQEKGNFDEEGKAITAALTGIKDHSDGMSEVVISSGEKNIKAFGDVQEKTKEYNAAITILGDTVQTFGGSLRKVVDGFKKESKKQVDMFSEPVDEAIKVLEQSALSGGLVQGGDDTNGTPDTPVTQA